MVAVTFWAIPTPANTRRQQKSTAIILFNCISPPKKLHLSGRQRGTSFLKKNALLKRFANFFGTENISATKRRRGAKFLWTAAWFEWRLLERSKVREWALANKLSNERSSRESSQIGRAHVC